MARLALGAFRAAASGCATEDLLVLLKTGLLGFTAQEVSALENYAYLWKITGAGWRQEFVRHPRGFGEEFTQEDREELSRLNGLRRRLVEPLLAFSAGTRDATGEEITDRLYGYFQAVGVEETLPAYCQALEEEGEESLSALQLRVWDLLLELLDQMRAILGEKRISRERYGRLLREVVEAEDVSEIPQTVDQVIFGTAEQVRQSSPKAAFLLGAAQGEFPLVPKSSGVFSDAERRELIALELPLGDPLEQKTMEERYLAYSVACAPSQRLYLSWPAQGEGEDKEPSELIAGVLAVFPRWRSSTTCRGSTSPTPGGGLLPDGRLLYTAHGGGRLPAAAVPGGPGLPGPDGRSGAGRRPAGGPALRPGAVGEALRGAARLSPARSSPTRTAPSSTSAGTAWGPRSAGPRRWTCCSTAP